jgi:hypothetical protein
MKTAGRTVKAMQDQWTALLPSKKVLPHRDEDLTFLYLQARKAGVKANDAKTLIANSLGISVKTLSERISTKSSPDKPKENPRITVG